MSICFILFRAGLIILKRNKGDHFGRSSTMTALIEAAKVAEDDANRGARMRAGGKEEIQMTLMRIQQHRSVTVSEPPFVFRSQAAKFDTR